MTATVDNVVVRTADSRPAAKLLVVDELRVFPEVQRRPPTRKLVKEIADKLDISALGTIHVSQRADGSLSVIDGQRRILALKMRGMGSHKANCLLYTGLTVKQEAALFRKLNHSRLVGAFDDFEKGAFHGDERDAGITRVMAKQQWTVGAVPKPGTASCVTSLRKVWDLDKTGQLLAKTIATLSEAFGRDKHTMASSLVSGTGKFLSKNGVDQSQLVEKLRAKFASPVSVITTARSRMDSEGGSLAQNVAAVMARAYDSRRRATR